MTRADDERWMARALELAERGWGRVQPNPLVGAVVLDADGRPAGEGAHEEWGGPHAEVHALRAAGERARGGTLYVTLEPCAHHGKTPPCADAVLAAGVSRVVVAVADPTERASGGADRLRAAGVDVEVGVLEQRARDQNAVFFHAATSSRPFVTLKYAMSLDARLSASEGVRTAITGAEAVAETHRLRAGHDAILVGVGTVLADDPMLTARGAVEPRVPPRRVVVDSTLRAPADARVAVTARDVPTHVFCGDDAHPERARELEARGVVVHPVPRAHGGGVDLPAVMAALHADGVRSVFCEGGGRLGSALLRAGLVDRHVVFVAPVLLGPGGAAAYHGVPRPWLERRGRTIRIDQFGADVLIEIAPPGEG